MPAPVPRDQTDAIAAMLRELRVSSGSPTLEALARRTAVSKSVLSDAFTGRKLPTERTIAAVVGTLGGNVEEFLALRASASPSRWAPPADSAPPRPYGARRLTPAGIALSVLTGVLGLLVGGLGVALVRPWSADPLDTGWDAAARTTPARVSVATGTDPAMTPCVDDAAVAASEARPHDTLLEIVWSDSCQAGWARITRYDGRAQGNAVSASLFRELAPSGTDRQDTTEQGVQGAYTTLLVRPTPETRVCATGEITLHGEHLSLGDPICL